jgi:diacylglycerol O-acyltransferase / wax synthase
LFEVNVFGALRVVQLALPRLLESRGRIVLIGSSSGGLGLPMLGVYSASKFALEGLADALRREMREFGIAVSLVIPGGIKTAMTEKHIAEVEASVQQLDADSEAKFGKLYKRHQQLLELLDMMAVAPDVVAVSVVKALNEPKPKPRYFCSIDQTILRTATQLLPESIWDELLPGLLDVMSGEKPITTDGEAPSSPWNAEAMNQLSSFDALMLFGETPRTPMHVSPFFIYDPSTAPNGVVRFKDILRTFEQRVALAPILKRKLVRVPFDLDEPYWVDDPDFDIEHHIRHVALPKPGDRRQLQILLARLTAYPMNLNRPVWDAYVIEGLDNVSGIPKGSFAVLLRIHHAAIDGTSGHAVLRVLHDLVPNPPKPKKPSRKDYVPAPMPSTGQMLSRAYFHLIDKPGKIAKVVANTVPAMRRAKNLKLEHPGEARSTPVTRFTGKMSSHRVVILLNLDMSVLRPVRLAAEGATLNDVIVSIVSGAMRKYLEAKGELPEQSMSTAMPVNTRTEADMDKPGNIVSMAMVNMHSDIVDPLQRVHAIHASAVFSKAYSNAVGAHIMADVAESVPTGITALGTRAASAAGLMEKLPVNTIVTNVPGPQVPFYMAGAKVVEFHAVGILIDGLGLFHSVNSYCGNIAITALADRQMMPDPAFYEECLRESYEEHIAAAASVGRVKQASARSATKSRPETVAVVKPGAVKVAKTSAKTPPAKKVPATKTPATKRTKRVAVKPAAKSAARPVASANKAASSRVAKAKPVKPKRSAAPAKKASRRKAAKPVAGPRRRTASTRQTSAVA